MSKRKKATILLVIALVVTFISGIILFIAYGKVSVYHEKSPYSNVRVVIQEDAKYHFFFAPFRIYDYELVVKKGFWGKTLLKEEFEFLDDLAPLHDYNVNIDWYEDHVGIEIECNESFKYDHEFVCYF